MKDLLNLIAQQSLRNLRAGHRPAHALRLALLNAALTNLKRSTKWDR